MQKFSCASVKSEFLHFLVVKKCIKQFVIEHIIFDAIFEVSSPNVALRKQYLLQ